MRSIKGKVAFITGGTKGIGYGIAEILLQNGVNVVITGRSEESVSKGVAHLKQTQGALGSIKGVIADVRDFESQKKAVAETVASFGKIDFVIANAGVGHFASLEDLTIEQWQKTIDTNLSGPFYTFKATLEQLVKTEGYYISISSLAGTNFFSGGTAYNASKFGLTGFTQAAMLDVRDKGVKVSTIMPGSVSTHFNGNEPSEQDDWKIQPEDIGKLVLDLLTMHPRTLPSKIEVRPAKAKK